MIQDCCIWFNNHFWLVNPSTLNDINWGPIYAWHISFNTANELLMQYIHMWYYFTNFYSIYSVIILTLILKLLGRTWVKWLLTTRIIGAFQLGILESAGRKRNMAGLAWGIQPVAFSRDMVLLKYQVAENFSSIVHGDERNSQKLSMWKNPHIAFVFHGGCSMIHQWNLRPHFWPIWMREIGRWIMKNFSFTGHFLGAIKWLQILVNKNHIHSAGRGVRCSIWSLADTPDQTVVLNIPVVYFVKPCDKM